MMMMIDNYMMFILFLSAEKRLILIKIMMEREIC